MKLDIEIRAAEGGNDACLLVQDQANIYRAFAVRNSLDISQRESVPAALG